MHPGAELNRIKKNYQDVPGRKATHLKGLSEELQGVQKIMFENIDAVLQRGELISGKRGVVMREGVGIVQMWFIFRHFHTSDEFNAALIWIE